jgi:hypothetical protein
MCPVQHIGGNHARFRSDGSDPKFVPCVLPCTAFVTDLPRMRPPCRGLTSFGLCTPENGVCPARVESEWPIETSSAQPQERINERNSDES